MRAALKTVMILQQKRQVSSLQKQHQLWDLENVYFTMKLPPCFLLAQKKATVPVRNQFCITKIHHRTLPSKITK